MSTFSRTVMAPKSRRASGTDPMPRPITRGVGRPEIGSSSNKTSPERERPRDFEAPSVGVGEAVGGPVEPRQQPVAEEPEDVAGLGPQRLFFGPDRTRSREREGQFAERAEEGRARAHG